MKGPLEIRRGGWRAEKEDGEGKERWRARKDAKKRGGWTRGRWWILERWPPWFSRRRKGRKRFFVVERERWSWVKEGSEVVETELSPNGRPPCDRKRDVKKVPRSSLGHFYKLNRIRPLGRLRKRAQ